MIKHLLQLSLIIACALSTTSCRASQPAAQESAPAEAITTRIVNIKNSFSSVSAGSIFNIEISQGQPKVEITSSPSAIAMTRFDVNDGRLSISLKNSGRNNNNIPEIKIRISMPTIRALKGSGAANFTIKGKIECEKLYIEGSGASSFRFNTINATDLDLELAGASRFISPAIDCSECSLDLAGGTSATITKITCVKLEAETSGAGHIVVSKVNCDLLDADASGGSTMVISAIDARKVNCDASGAANITLSGHCETADYDASGASKISAKNLSANNVSIDKSGVATISTK